MRRRLVEGLIPPTVPSTSPALRRPVEGTDLTRIARRRGWYGLGGSR